MFVEPLGMFSVVTSIFAGQQLSGAAFLDDKAAVSHVSGFAPFATTIYAGGLPSGVVTFLPAVLMVAVFYLLLFRPNQRKQKVWQEMMDNLKIGDKITTTGGMRGTIVALREDAIQLKLPPDGVKVEIVKSAIAAVTTNTPEQAK